MNRRFGVAFLVLALAALPPVSGTASELLPNSDVHQQWDLLGAEETGISATTNLTVDRGQIGGTSMVPAPRVHFYVVGKVQGATGAASWTVELRSPTAVLASAWFNAGDTSYTIKPNLGDGSSFDWPATPTNITSVRLVPSAPLGSVIGTFALRKASIRLVQSGTVKATQGRVPVAPGQTITSSGFADVLDPMLYTHDTSGFVPAPTIKLRFGSTPASNPELAKVRLVNHSTGAPVPGSEISGFSIGGSRESGALALTAGATYRLQAAHGGNSNWKIRGAELVFYQSTADPLGIESAVAWYPATSTPFNLTVNGVRNEHMIRPPTNDTELSRLQWIFVAQRLTGTGSVQALPVSTSGTELVAPSDTLQISSPNYVRKATSVATPPIGSAWWDTKPVLSAATTGRLAGSLFRASLRLRGTITALDASNLAFSPNGDNSKESTLITGTIHADAENPAWRLSITNAANTEVKFFTGNGNSISQLWLGTDQNEELVPDGGYTVTLSLPGLSSAIRQIPVLVDRVAPMLEALAPIDEGHALAGQQPIVIQISDASAGIDASTRTVTLTDQTAGTPPLALSSSISGGILRSSDATLVVDHAYLAQVQLSDLAGNRTTRAIDFRAITVDVPDSGDIDGPVASVARTGATTRAVSGTTATFTFSDVPLILPTYEVNIQGHVAHPGFGYVRQIVDLTDARVHLYTNSPSGEVEAPNSPVNAPLAWGTRTTFAQFVAANQTAGTHVVPVMAVQLYVPELRIDTDSSITRAEIELIDGAMTSAVPVCDDPTTCPVDSFATTDPLPFFLNAREATLYEETWADVQTSFAEDVLELPCFEQPNDPCVLPQLGDHLPGVIYVAAIDPAELKWSLAVPLTPANSELWYDVVYEMYPAMSPLVFQGACQSLELCTAPEAAERQETAGTVNQNDETYCIGSDGNIQEEDCRQLLYVSIINYVPALDEREDSPCDIYPSLKACEGPKFHAWIGEMTATLGFNDADEDEFLTGANTGDSPPNSQDFGRWLNPDGQFENRLALRQYNYMVWDDVDENGYPVCHPRLGASISNPAEAALGSGLWDGQYSGQYHSNLDQWTARYQAHQYCSGGTADRKDQLFNVRLGGLFFSDRWYGTNESTLASVYGHRKTTTSWEFGCGPGFDFGPGGPGVGFGCGWSAEANPQEVWQVSAMTNFQW